MIKKLRTRFILTAILSVFIVLTVLIGGINLFNYRQVVSESDKVLSFLMENGGSFPEMLPHVPENIPGGPGGEQGRDQGRMGGWTERINSPEFAYETRFFSVEISSDGKVSSSNTGKIAAIDKDTAEEYGMQVYRSGKTSGFIGDYRYSAKDSGGVKLIVFYDCGRSLSNFRSFLIISVIISLIGLILVSVIIFFASGRIIKPVAESYEKQKRFITDAGHEIKTPLAIINADSDVLSMDLGEDNEWLSDIKKQTSRLTELTNDLILLSKMEEGSSVLVMDDIDLSQMVMEQAESFKAVAVTGGKRFDTAIADNIHINGDKKTVGELVSILFDNAVKYCPEDGKVKAKLVRNGKYAVLEVTNDTKEDISSEEMKHFFDRFYRADESRNSETGGHGIGLSIAKAIAESHSAKMTVAKKRERTITFTTSFAASTNVD